MTPCTGCALTDGACANREPHNQLTAIICARAGIPFYCHDTTLADWRQPVEFRAAVLRRQPVPICQGWVRDVRALQAAGLVRNGARAEARRRRGRAVLVARLHPGIERRGRLREAARGEDLEELLALLHAPHAVSA